MGHMFTPSNQPSKWGGNFKIKPVTEQWELAETGVYIGDCVFEAYTYVRMKPIGHAVEFTINAVKVRVENVDAI